MNNDPAKIPITKAACQKIIKNVKRSYVYMLGALCVVSSIAAVAFLSINGYVKFSILLFAWAIYAAIVSIRSFHTISRSAVYIEKDTVVDTKKGYKFTGKSTSAEKTFSFYFDKNGKYRISKPIYKELIIGQEARERFQTEEHSLENFREGKEFYLLISEYKGKKKILEIFSANVYELANGDFDAIGDQYIVNSAKNRQKKVV